MKMSKEEFVETVKSKIADHLPKYVADNCEVRIHNVTKHNDRQLTALVVVGKEDGVLTPNFYLEEAYEEYLDHGNIDFMLDEFAAVIKECWGKQVPKEFFQMDYDKIKEKLIFCVVDKKLNEKILEGCPHKDYENGLAVIYGINVEENARIVINNDLARHEKYDLEDMQKSAKENMKEKYKAVLLPVTQAICAFNNESKEKYDLLTLQNPDLDDVMYVLSNKPSYFGASSLFYDGVKEKISELFHADYFAIPSSVHEWMIIPDRGEHDAGSLQKMLRDVNKQIRENDVLSDDVFKYCKDTHQLKRLTA